MTGSPLGLPSSMSSDQASNWRDALAELWFITMRTPPGDLEEDLARLRQWFDPVAQGSRLRRDLLALAAPSTAWEDPGPPTTLSVSGGKSLVTPEGRCVLEMLTQGSKDWAEVTFADASLLAVERRLLLLYRSWNRHRLQSVVDLLQGKTKPLQIPAAGVVLALLINRCTAPERALTRFAGGSQRDVVDEAFFTAVTAFVEALAPGRRRNAGNATLVSGWMLYEAARRLGAGMIVTDARGGQDGAVWIAPGASEQVLDVLARDLARGHRSRIGSDALGKAFDALVTSLRDQLAGLAAFGLAHERPLETAHTRALLLAAFLRHTAA